MWFEGEVLVKLRIGGVSRGKSRVFLESIDGVVGRGWVSRWK